jgi:hypothetical protein
MMNNRTRFRGLAGLLLLVLVVSLAACNRQAATATGQACATPEPGNVLYTNDSAGYCLIYPEGYVQEGPAESTMISPAPGRQGQEPQQPFVTIDVVETQGMTAAGMADQMMTDMPMFEMERSELTLGGEEAVVLDRVPGQDLNRQVLVVHDEQLYVLSFFPSDPARGETFTQMETLYATVTNSFQFLPQE